MDQRYDVVVCGLGPAGLEALSALAGLASGRLRIAGLEARDRIGIPGQLAFLASQATEAGLAGLARTIVPGIAARTASQGETTRPIAVHVLNGEAFVRSRLERTGHAEIITGCRVLRSWHQRECVVLETTAGSLRAGAVVDASGEDSPLAREAQIGKENEPTRHYCSRLLEGDETADGAALLMDLFDPDFEGGLLFADSLPVDGGTRYTATVWTRDEVPEDLPARKLDEYLERRGIRGEAAREERGARRTGSLRPLHRGRLLFAGTAGGLGVPFTGQTLVSGLHSARAAARTALRAVQVGPDPDKALEAVARYDRQVHDGRFGITFRFQDVGQDVVLRLSGPEADRFFGVLFALPGELLEGFLACSLPMRDLHRMVWHYWKRYRFEELPWIAAMNGALAALAGYARVR